MERVEGKIAAILDRTTVVINRGARDGVSEDDVFWIYSELGPFTDPDTKENLGTTKEIWGKVVVTTVEERFCVAKTEYQVKNFAAMMGLANIFGTTTEQIRLPVDESQISNKLTKIKVGFNAILQKQQAEIVEKKVAALPAKTSDEDEASNSVQSREKLNSSSSDASD